jgi:hypothetical protein
LILEKCLRVQIKIKKHTLIEILKHRTKRLKELKERYIKRKLIKILKQKKKRLKKLKEEYIKYKLIETLKYK